MSLNIGDALETGVGRTFTRAGLTLAGAFFVLQLLVTLFSTNMNAPSSRQSHPPRSRRSSFPSARSSAASSVSLPTSSPPTSASSRSGRW